MNLEQILNEWKKDCKISPEDLDDFSINIPVLHAKYLEILSNERNELTKIKSMEIKLKKLLISYYKGELNNKEDLSNIDREPFKLNLIKSEVQEYVDADDDLIKIRNKIEEQKIKVDALYEIMKSIDRRGFTIKNSIDWNKLMGGH